METDLTSEKYLEVNPTSSKLYLYTKFCEYNQSSRSSKGPVHKQPSRSSKGPHKFDPDLYFSEGVFPSTSTPSIGTSQERRDLKAMQYMENPRESGVDRKKQKELKAAALEADRKKKRN